MDKLLVLLSTFTKFIFESLPALMELEVNYKTCFELTVNFSCKSSFDLMGVDKRLLLSEDC